MSHDYGWEFKYYPKSNKLGKHEDLTKLDVFHRIVKNEPANGNDCYVKCYNCNTYMRFEAGEFFGTYICPVCGSKCKEERLYNQFERENKRYLENLEEDVPEGCAACGGPWPNCKDSCQLYDE